MRLTPLLGFLFLPILTPLAALAATVISVGDGDTLRDEEAGRKLMILVALRRFPRNGANPYGQQVWEAFQAHLLIGSTANLRTQTKERNGRTGGEDSATSEPDDHQSLIQYWS